MSTSLRGREADRWRITTGLFPSLGPCVLQFFFSNGQFCISGFLTTITTTLPPLVFTEIPKTVETKTTTTTQGRRRQWRLNWQKHVYVINFYPLANFRSRLAVTRSPTQFWRKWTHSKPTVFRTSETSSKASCRNRLDSIRRFFYKPLFLSGLRYLCFV